MERRVLAACLSLLAVLLVSACATSPEIQGQRLFSGCPDGVDARATVRAGVFVCEGDRERAPFAGNGRACGDCHVPGDHFGISVARIALLPRDNPFFYPGLDEDQALLRQHGLVRVVVAGQLNEFRQTPKLTHLQKLCDEKGNCATLGLLGNRVRNLCAFSVEAIQNHMSKTTARVPGRDFRLPTEEECDALVAYMLSDLVADVGSGGR